MDIVDKLRLARSILYVPGSNARALQKARALDADMLIIDLEDSVSEENKASARAAAIAASQDGFPGKLVALRVNGINSAHLAEDLAASAQCRIDAIVIPKVDSVTELDLVASKTAIPIIAMIETPVAIFDARPIAMHPAVIALLVGANDLAADSGIRPGPQRQGLEMALQTIIMAAAVAGKPAFDSPSSQLDDLDGFEAECMQGRCFGFTGKTLIHPNQIPIANAAFSPSMEELADAHEMVAAAKGGAQRFRGRMIESMHVEEALRTIERAGARAGTDEGKSG